MVGDVAGALGPVLLYKGHACVLEWRVPVLLSSPLFLLLLSSSSSWAGESTGQHDVDVEDKARGRGSVSKIVGI